MSPLLLVVLGLVTASFIAVMVFVAVWFLRREKARRAALAALIGGTIGFAATALVQAPFYMKASGAAPTVPMIISCIASAAMALLAVMMILRTKPTRPLPPPPLRGPLPP